MSSPAGDPSGFIDTQGISVENKTDGIIYSQVLSLIPGHFEHSKTFHQLTNDTVEKLFGLTDAQFKVTLLATQPELNALINLTLPVLAQLPSREWVITMTDQSNRNEILTGFAIIGEFTIIDQGVGLATVEFTLEFISGAVAPGSSIVAGVMSI